MLPLLVLQSTAVLYSLMSLSLPSTAYPRWSKGVYCGHDSRVPELEHPAPEVVRLGVLLAVVVRTGQDIVARLG